MSLFNQKKVYFINNEATIKLAYIVTNVISVDQLKKIVSLFVKLNEK